MGKMKVIVVGLPLFSKRLAIALKKFDPENEYISLDTYYNRWDKLKAYFKIPHTDIVVSINGTIQTSRVFDRAFEKGVPVIMNWVGTDVLKSIEAFKSGNYRKEYISKAIHFCEVSWIKDELKQIGVEAEIVNFAAFDKKYDATISPNKQFTALTYIPEKRSQFYGMLSILKIAEKVPEIQFVIAGTTANDFQPLPANVTALGWVSNMNEVFDDAHVCIRFPEHDGLSTFILEGLARGKQVIYKYPFDYCQVAKDEQELFERLKEFESQFKRGTWKINDGGINFIQTHFNENVIIGGLIDKFKKISGK